MPRISFCVERHAVDVGVRDVAHDVVARLATRFSAIA